ncbi:uncharacterized protein AC631_01516 [Debaryomyces fabryi]|uniref:Uncharacterized protein n=1 Tax=Debaryomyces fabryi TaxID=58627 RepID=A0A0V1Q2S5_9ASCO|nr:uncharacterized protein AC631_01516 [Debaryomyces fabryi]KSA02716.1 hypothetical protein AC631_01516 [Debaryomyces fabryi]CUM56917.1 unnamed protein product [Debaryomyces fabryi]
MLKTFFPSWYKKPIIPAEEIPNKFITREDKQAVQYTMNDKDSFVDINYKKLSYAEVAALSKGKPMVSKVKKTLKPTKHTNTNYKILTTLDNDDDLGESVILPEKFKSDIHYKKSKQFKQPTRKKSNNAVAV